MADDPVSLIAESTAESVTNRFAQAAERMIADAQDQELTEDDIAAGLWELSDSALDQDAAEAIRQSVREGRADGFGAENLPDGVIWRRSSVLEDNSCQSCVDADGSEIDGPDDDLTDIHEGPPETCLCMQYADLTELSDEEAAAVEADIGDEAE